MSAAADRGLASPRRLNPGPASGEADGAVTEELDQAQSSGTTADCELPYTIAKLGVEAQAEYIRVRARLGLDSGPSEPPQQLGAVGRYQLKEEIGRGGMGVVYRAHDPELDRSVAIKLVRLKPFAQHEKLRARLLREAKILAKLSHSNVVQIYDCGQHNGEVFLAMEYIEGQTLRIWQEKGSHDQRSLLNAYAQAASGLVAAHDHGIVHRDFKPDNILVANDGRVLVGDFGLAGFPIPDEVTSAEGIHIDRVTATRTGALLGTPAYMAPEQLRGDTATPRSDQFAFCVSLWEALTSQRPFNGEDRDELLEQIERQRAVGTELLPRRLRSVLLRGLSVDPDERLPDLRALEERIQPRGNGVLVGAVSILGLGLAAGVLGSKLFSAAPANECELRDSIVELRSMPQWDSLDDQLSDRSLHPSLGRLVGHLDRLEAEAHDLCEMTANEDVLARRQHLALWIADLAGFIETSPGRSTAAVLADISQLEDARLSAPPPQALDQQVIHALQQSREQERLNRLEEALALADQAIDLANGEDLELVRAHQRRGRVLALLGRHALAMSAYRDAISRADAATYDDARLDTELLAARTAIMRLEDVDRGCDALERARGLLRRMSEPWLSPRRADYHEVFASALKRRGSLDAALENQWLVLLLRAWQGDIAKIGLAHLNLATIYEMRSRSGDTAEAKNHRFAQTHYERAVEVLEPTNPSPEWFQATFDLGHWLMQQGTQEQWNHARNLLEGVQKHSSDLRVHALIDLVLLTTQLEDVEAVGRYTRELNAALSKAPAVSEIKRLDARVTMAVGYAMSADVAAFELERKGAMQLAEGLFEGATLSQKRYARTQIASMDLSAAEFFSATDPAHASNLAGSARDNLLLLPEDVRPVAMLNAANRLSSTHID